MKLHNLKPAEGSVKSRKRVGRGQGSTRGGTSTRGHNGAKSRSGYSQKLGFEGGQMPLYRRVPKYGFKNPFRTEYKVFNLGTLQEYADKFSVSTIDLAWLKEHKLISKTDLVKILGNGELKAKLEVEAHKFSKSAEEAIVAAGGKVNKLKVEEAEEAADAKEAQSAE